METCVIIGGGGHARMLVDALTARTDIRLVVVDTDARLHGALLLGVPVVGGDAMLAELHAGGARYFAVGVGVGAACDNGPRRRLFEHAHTLGFEPLAIVHARAVVSAWAQLGLGVQLLPGAIVNAGARLGCNVIVNSGAIVEHDVTVGDHAHIATGARVASTVSVGAGAHIGAGAVIRQCITIGDGAVVGAGAVVIRDVDAHSVVAGVPARPLRAAAIDTPSLQGTGTI